MLSCGLQDFAVCGADASSSSSAAAAAAGVGGPGGVGAVVSAKLHSVVGILAHLSGSHTANIKKAVAELFLWSCAGAADASGHAKTAIGNSELIFFDLFGGRITNLYFSQVWMDWRSVKQPWCRTCCNCRRFRPSCSTSSPAR